MIKLSEQFDTIIGISEIGRGDGAYESYNILEKVMYLENENFRLKEIIKYIKEMEKDYFKMYEEIFCPTYLPKLFDMVKEI